jgi:hypothetical protein
LTVGTWHIALGYTIFDNAILFDGAIFVVTEDPLSLPPMSSVVTQRDDFIGANVEVLSKDQALSGLGDFAGK